MAHRFSRSLDHVLGPEETWRPRYGLVLFLTVATCLYMSLAPSAQWASSVAVLLQAATMLAALRTVGKRTIAARFAALGVMMLAAAAIAIFFAADTGSLDTRTTGTSLLIAALFVAFLPALIALGVWRDIRRRGTIGVQSLLGTMSIYLLIGILFAFIYGSIAAVDPGAFYTDGTEGGIRSHIYFSFVTLTTLGYGDLTPALAVGRTLAISEALIGQIYLVTIIGVVVGQLGWRERSS